MVTTINEKCYILHGSIFNPYLTVLFNIYKICLSQNYDVEISCVLNVTIIIKLFKTCFFVILAKNLTFN